MKDHSRKAKTHTTQNNDIETPIDNAAWFSFLPSHTLAFFLLKIINHELALKTIRF